MKNLPAQFIRDFSSGQVNSVSPNLTPPNSVDLSLNLEPDENIGELVTRLGSAYVGSQLVNNKTVLGLHQHVDPDNVSNNKLFATINDSSDTNADIFIVGGAISLANDTQGIKTRFFSFEGETVRLNGTDAAKAWNNSSWITTGGVFDLGDMPANVNLVSEFRDRIYVMAEGSQTLHYSDLLTSGAIAWSGNNIVLNPDDNAGGGTGFGRVPGYLLIFKERAFYRWNFYNAFPEQLLNFGAVSQESIVSAGGLCAFFSGSSPNARGFYITNGGYPQPISHMRAKGIKKWVDAISPSNYGNISGFGNEIIFGWSIGDVTVDNVAYTNVVVVWNRLTDTWRVRSYPAEFRVFAPYLASGELTIVGGGTDGYVTEIDKRDTYSDADGSPVYWKMRTHRDKFGFNQEKIVSDKVVIETNKMNEGHLAIEFDDERQEYPAMESSISVVEIDNLRASKFVFELSGAQIGSRGSIVEMEIPHVAVQQTYKRE